MEIILVTTILIAVISLLWLAWIDLKLWILPNELVLLFAAMAVPFHISIYAIYGDWIYGGWLLFVFGAILGGGTLWVIRALANKFYGMETMGLGDVKLLAAAGLWLGPHPVLVAMSLGAFCGVLHALVLAFAQGYAVTQTRTITSKWPTFIIRTALTLRSMRRMMLPAGPGFIAGILATLLWTYKDLLP